MADLTELQATQGIKIAGADSTGQETGWVPSTTEGLSVSPSPGVDRSFSGNITALNGNVIANSAQGCSSATFQLLGTWVGTVKIQATIDGINWADCLFITSAQAIVSSTTVNGAYFSQCAAATQLRVIATAFTSGTINVVINASQSIQNLNSIGYGQFNSSALALASGQWSPHQIDQAGNSEVSLGAREKIVALATGQSATLTVTGCSTVTMTVPTNATWSGSIQFFGSTDGVNFSSALTCFDIVNYSSTAPKLTIFSTPGIQSIGVNVSGYKFLLIQAGSNTGTLTMTTISTFVSNATNQHVIVDGGTVSVAQIDGQKLTYSAAINSGAPAASATDVFTITGSATKIVRITKFAFFITQTTAGVVALFLLKRSTANTGGTSVAQTRVPHDSTSAAATATVLAYTANPTVGTLVGNVRTAKVFASTTLTQEQQTLFEFGQGPEQAIVLRGTGEVLAINLNGVTVAGGSYNAYVEWTEE